MNCCLAHSRSQLIFSYVLTLSKISCNYYLVRFFFFLLFLMCNVHFGDIVSLWECIHFLVRVYVCLTCPSGWILWSLKAWPMKCDELNLNHRLVFHLLLIYETGRFYKHYWKSAYWTDFCDSYALHIYSKWCEKWSMLLWFLNVFLASLWMSEFFNKFNAIDRSHKWLESIIAIIAVDNLFTLIMVLTYSMKNFVIIY